VGYPYAVFCFTICKLVNCSVFLKNLTVPQSAAPLHCVTTLHYTTLPYLHLFFSFSNGYFLRFRCTPWLTMKVSGTDVLPYVWYRCATIWLGCNRPFRRTCCLCLRGADIHQWLLNNETAHAALHLLITMLNVQ
jgi:hypothetical protein